MRRHLNERYKQLLKLLSDGKYHSGVELGGILKTSRTTIAKYVQQIQNLGLDIYVVKGKGYSLPNPIELLNEDLINQEVGGAKVSVFDMIDSTNSYMMSYLDNFELGSCILAETQTMGVGRGNTSWISPLGCQMILSMYWQIPLAHISGLSLAIGLSTVNTLKKLGIEQVGLKWPNDVCCNNKKLAGILIETRSTIDDCFHVVIGTGLNVIASSSIKNPHMDAIALNEINKQPLSRNHLVIEMIKDYRRLLESFAKEGFAPLQNQWNQQDLYYGSKIKLINKQDGRTIIEGIERGTDRNGCILIENASHKVESFNIGDVSLRF